MMDGLLLALQFMSRIPVKKQIDFNSENIRSAVACFPLVGLILGLASGGIFFVLSDSSGPIASISALLVSVVMTGGLHLDGLSDTMDGFLSNRDRDKTMEIMKDSRIGAFGTLSLILVLLTKFAVMSEISSIDWWVIPVAMINGRFAAAYMISKFPSARTEGLGSLFKEAQSVKLVGVIFAAYAIILMILKPAALLAAAAAILCGHMIGHWSVKKINGLTGDVYGAGIELSETLSLALCWGVMQWI
jgi:adenosylcobinamide-GDP ribazoletransferase